MRIRRRLVPRIEVTSRQGFVMPVVIVVLSVLGVSLAGAFSYVISERMTVANLDAQDRAFEIAQEGLETFISSRTSLGFVSAPPAVLEEIDIDIDEGWAEVVLERIRPQLGDTAAVYVVRSTGVVPGFRDTDPDARRTVARMAVFQAGTMNVRAGWTSLTGLHKNGAAGTLSGVDACGQKPTVAGVSVPNSPGFTSSGGFSPTGTPGTELLGTVGQAIDSLGIDWVGIRGMTSITPNVIIPGASWPSFANPAYWPTIHVTGNLTLGPGQAGRGILIVTGTITLNGATSWQGIVLAGGKITGNGNQNIQGAALSGLDAMLQPNDAAAAAWATAQGTNSTGNGTKLVQYNSCHVSQALSQFGGLRSFDNAWMDNWPTL